MVNLLRWTSLRSIKETFVPARHFAYPFLEPDPPPAVPAETVGGLG
jgi:1-pyrroline-5-carboxylate dehydrogenase